MFIANMADSGTYFRSLLHWESCLAQAYQAHELLFTMRAKRFFLSEVLERLLKRFSSFMCQASTQTR
jgi:hypothetical protein